jgi:hypothetical protein
LRLPWWRKDNCRRSSCCPRSNGRGSPFRSCRCRRCDSNWRSVNLNQEALIMRTLEEFEIKLTKIVTKMIIVFIVYIFITGFWMFFFNLKEEFRFLFFPITCGISYITVIL